MVLSDKQINDAKNRAPLQLQGHFEHNDCIRMAYEWLDAQVKTKNRRMTYKPIKHIIEKWSGRYVSTSDVEVAAWLHPDIIGTYPNFNISSRLTFPSVLRLSGISEAGKHNPIGAHYNNDTYSINEKEWDSTSTNYDENALDRDKQINIFKYGPEPDVGVNLGIRNGRIVRFANLVDQGLGTINVLETLHDSLRSTSRSILLNHTSIGNKYKSVLDALNQYHRALDTDLDKVDITILYSEGLNLETEYKMALHYSGDELEEYPEFSRTERTGLELLMRRHAVFINSTPDGAALVEAELRYQRSGDEEVELIQQSLAASKVLLERPDIIDPDVANLIGDNVSPPSSDPNANRKKILARTMLTNLSIVTGYGAAIFYSASLGAAPLTIVGTLGGYFAVNSVKALSEISSEEGRKWISSEKPILRPLAEFFKNTWYPLNPVFDDAFPQEWFDSIHELALSEGPAWTTLDFYVDEVSEYLEDIDVEALAGIIQHMGPVLHNRDASLVACNDETEKEMIAIGYGVLKLGLSKEEAEALVAIICNAMKVNRYKHRVTFYYLMAEKVNQLKKFHSA
jgi:hypothetical protein